MKKVTVLLLILMISVLWLPALSAGAAYEVPFTVTANAVYMVNLDSGRVVYEKNARSKIYPASVTKIMTAVLALENIKNIDTEKIVCEPYMLEEFQGLGYSYSNAGLRNYEEFIAKDLIYAIMVYSASDAANTLAAYLGDGSIDVFIGMMNDKAEELGMHDTNFANPHGLHNDNHYTTAYDLYLLAQYAISLPGFMEIAETTTHPFTTNLRQETEYLSTTNWLQDDGRHPEFYYPYVRGIKTGTTDEAGSCLVSTATKNGYTYLLVLMGCPSYDEAGNFLRQSFYETPEFYEWAFRNLTIKTLIDAENEPYITEVPLDLAWGKDALKLRAEESFSDLTPTNYEASSVYRQYNLPEVVNAPVQEGDFIGTVDVVLSDEVIGTVNLLAAETVERSTALYVWAVIKTGLQSTWFKIGLGFVLLFLIFFIITMIISNRRKKIHGTIHGKPKKRKRQKPRRQKRWH